MKALASNVGSKISFYIVFHRIYLPYSQANIYNHQYTEVSEPLADWNFTVYDLVSRGTTPNDHLNANDSSKVQFYMLKVFLFGFHDPEVQRMLRLIIIFLVLDVVIIGQSLMLPELHFK